ncbi:hypothetical protein EON63_11340 [archaeon]|nr:MAG: hypothetical protein EON63_11340 [archaeon]
MPVPTDHSLLLKALYADLLDTPIGGISRATSIHQHIQLITHHRRHRGTGNVTFRDLHNRPLSFPALTFPFRR